MPEGSSMCHQNDTCSGLDPFCTFCHNTTSTKRTFNDTIVRSGTI